MVREQLITGGGRHKMRDCLTAGDSPLSLCLCAVLYGAFGYESVLLIVAGSEKSGWRP